MNSNPTTKRQLAIIVVLALAICHPLESFAATVAVHSESDLVSDTNVVVLNVRQTAATFEGIGALSAGASSRLLLDYPEPQRSDILDFLFKPKFGAAIQHLKVEIGGDVDSTDGTEPSIARTREEFLNPKPEYFNRGYEWWLMKEAKRRNPQIIFDILQWGAPGWIGDGKFYSQDNADFIVAFIRGAKKYHDLDISYCGIWNEKHYDIEWIKLLRRTLNRNGLERVQIVAADQTPGNGDPDIWRLARELPADRELANAVAVIGAHYPKFTSTETAKNSGKRLWSSEDGPWSGKWGVTTSPCAGLPQAYNRNYVLGKMTKTVIWSPISCYYNNLPLPGSGMMQANEPWSGHYEVQPAIWLTAHTTQFIEPGWKYLAGDACRMLPGGGSQVAAVSPDGQKLSVVIETMGAKSPQNISFKLAGDLTSSNLHVWRSTAQEQFIQLDDIPVAEGAFVLDVQPEAVYSLTTTTGQHKGTATIPPFRPFPLPYRDDFGSYAVGATPKYLADFYGAFEVAKNKGGGKCLKQVITRRGIAWSGDSTPVTIIGSPAWRDYEVAGDVCFDFKQFACIYGRIVRIDGPRPPAGYGLRLNGDGAWQLLAGKKQILSGNLAVAPGSWHRAGLRFMGDQITVILDGKAAGTVTDATYRNGLVGLGCDYEAVKFDNLTIDGATAVSGLTPVKVTSSSDWSAEFAAEKAVDGDPNTRWNVAPREHTGWLELDFGKPTKVARAVIDESFATRITKFAIEAQQPDGTWKAILTGTTIGAGKDLNFAPVTAPKFRLNILESPSETPTINEFQLFSH